MALYREGRAAMAADGTVTGTGTKWQSSLSLIRPGATIMFLSSPIQMAVVNKVVSDTEIKAITTKGAVVASTDYAIMLSDSLTVDGLAQDVAETLRYYQSQETVIADAVEFFKDFDFESIQNLANQIKQDSETAESSAAAAAASESAAKTSEANAKASETAAKTSETNAKASEVAAETARDQVQQIIDDAGEQSTLAVLAQPGGANRIGLQHGGKVQHLQTFLSFDMFGINKDGSSDVTSQIISVFNLANSLGLKVKQNDGVYLISGSDIITSNYGYDLEGATLRPSSGYTGYILYTQVEQPVTYSAGSELITKINSAAILAGTSVLKGLLTDTTLNGKAIFMFGDNDPLYVSRGKTKNWWHISRISSRGKMDDACKYGVSEVTSIIALPINKKLTDIRLPNWDFVNEPANNGVMRFQNFSRCRIYGGQIFNRPINDHEKSPVIISMSYAYDVKFYDLYDEHPSWPIVGGSIAYAYTLNFNYCCRLEFNNCNSQGYGWGVVGGQLSCNITYRDCNLNRIDMHDPFSGYLKVIDCDIGFWGICATGMGDLYVERCTINLEDSAMNGYREHDGIISGRGDFGGWFDGKVYIRDLKIVGDAEAFRAANGRGVSLFSPYSFNATTGSIPSGSPVEPWGFKEIYVDGLHCDTPIVGKRFSSIVYAASVQYTTYFPRVIQIKNADFNSTEPECFDMHGFLVSPDNAAKAGIAHTLNFKPTNFIQMDDCSLAGVEIKRPYSQYDYNNLSFRARNLRQANGQDSPIEFWTDQVGRYEFDSCDIKKLSDSTETTSSVSSRQSTFAIRGGNFNSLTESPFNIQYNTGLSTQISVDGTIFIGPYSQTAVNAANLNLAEFATLSNCKVYSNETNGFVTPALWLGSTSNASTAFNVARGNTLDTVITVSNTNAGGDVVSGISTQVAKVPSGVVNGHISASFYVDATGTTGTYQLYLNARSTKAQVGKIVSNGKISGIYLQ